MLFFALISQSYGKFMTCTHFYTLSFSNLSLHLLLLPFSACAYQRSLVRKLQCYWTWNRIFHRTYLPFWNIFPNYYCNFLFSLWPYWHVCFGNPTTSDAITKELLLHVFPYFPFHITPTKAPNAQRNDINYSVFHLSPCEKLLGSRVQSELIKKWKLNISF